MVPKIDISLFVGIKQIDKQDCICVAWFILLFNISAMNAWIDQGRNAETRCMLLFRDTEMTIDALFGYDVYMFDNIIIFRIFHLEYFQLEGTRVIVRNAEFFTILSLRNVLNSDVDTSFQLEAELEFFAVEHIALDYHFVINGALEHTYSNFVIVWDDDCLHRELLFFGTGFNLDIFDHVIKVLSVFSEIPVILVLNG